MSLCLSIAVFECRCVWCCAALKNYWSTCSTRFEQQARVADQAEGDLKRVNNDLKGESRALSLDPCSHCSLLYTATAFIPLSRSRYCTCCTCIDLVWCCVVGDDVPDKHRAMLQADATKLQKKIQLRPIFGAYAASRRKKLKQMVLDMKC